MKKRLLLSHFLLLFIVSSSQNIDSLKTISLKLHDNEKGYILMQIGKIYQQKNELDSAILYLNNSIKILKSPENLSEAIHTLGMAYFFKNDFTNTLENFKLSLKYAKQTKNDSVIARRYSDLGVAYDYLGAFDKSVEYYYKALGVFEKKNDKQAMSKAYNNLGIITQNRGNAKQSLKLYEKSLKLKKETNTNKIEIASSYLNLGSAYEQLKEYDKSLKFYNKSLEVFENSNRLNYYSLALSNIAGVYFFKENMDSANFFNEKSFRINDSLKNNFGLVKYYRLKGNILIKQNKVENGILYLNKALILADTLNVISNKKDILNDLVTVLKKEQNFDKAFFFQEKLMAIKDTLSNEKSNNKIETLKIVYETDKKEKEILLLQTKAKRKAQRNRIVTSILAFILLLIGIITLLIFRQKLTKSKHEAEIFNQKLLRLQMNPHFIFNTLASIQSYMLEKNTKQAAMYLSAFSKLTRSILNNSREEFITLQEDIETIDNYLKIQQMRFENSFEYDINIDDKIDSDNVQVAPMLIQPFVENAVVHGFKNVNYKGIIEVEYKKLHKNIEVIIEDNGRGFENQENKLHKSHALNITKERLRIINKFKKQKISFQIINKQDKGVKVVFLIPYIKNISK